jgi:hypothetical protein
MITEFHKKYADKIEGTISCFDRILITGSLTRWGYAEAMRSYLLINNIRIFDYPLFAKQYNEQIRQQIESISKEHKIEIEYIRSPHKFDKQANIQKILEKRGNEPGIVKIYSSMELCDSYSPYFNKEKNSSVLRLRNSKCIHYYIYLIDKVLGLCFFKIPTWLPCRVQFYFNGHNYLEYKLKKHNIEYEMEDNAFSKISDYQKAQELSDNFRTEVIHNWLDIISSRYIPFLVTTNQTYRWSITQAEYSTDLIFKNSEAIKSIYEELVLKCIHTVKPGNIATFFSRKLAANYEDEVGSKYNKQIQGTRIKHFMGANSIKIYDKGKTILRIETTINDIGELKIYRDVVTKSGETVTRLASMKKSIYSFYDLGKHCNSSNSRYLDYLASFTDNSDGRNKLNKLSGKKVENDRSYKGFNFFDKFDSNLFQVLLSGEFNINGFRNKSLRKRLKHSISASQMSRVLKRLKLFGLIKKVKNTFKYYLTKLGKKVIAAGLIVKELGIVPALT